MPRHEANQEEAHRRERAKRSAERWYRTEPTRAETVRARPHDTYGCVDWFDYGRPEPPGRTVAG
ncbi:MAG: hypothetical protein O9284_05985 [Steroidobacteraceae bacterium]|jgi:hypothetical protein|nr:hypothetical protein [Steroidobacteraceae bacterium]